MMSRYKNLSIDWTREILYSLRLCVVFVLQSRTRFPCPKTIVEYSEKEPALQWRRQSTCRTQSSLKPGLGATEVVLD